MTSNSSLCLFSGTSNLPLAKQIGECLGIGLGQIDIHTFPDQEIAVRICENVRNRDVFVVQSIAIRPNHYLMELLIIIDALKRASARSICAVIPYFGYCRQDRKDTPRVPITAKLVANLLATAGISHVISMDLHAPQLEGFFDLPVDNLYARPLFMTVLKAHLNEPCVIVAPDIGSVKLTRPYATALGAPFAVVDKIRISSDCTKVAAVMGEVANKHVLLADDICLTCKTMSSAAKACHEKGARSVMAIATHCLLDGEAIQTLDSSPIQKLLVTDTVPELVSTSPKICRISAAPLFAHAIQCMLSGGSISSKYTI